MFTWAPDHRTTEFRSGGRGSDAVVEQSCGGYPAEETSKHEAGHGPMVHNEGDGSASECKLA